MSTQELENPMFTEGLEEKLPAEAQELVRPVIKSQKSAMQSYRLENYSYEPPSSPTSQVSGRNISDG